MWQIMISPEYNVVEMDKIIRDIKANVRDLMNLSGGMQCVDRNCVRIMAGIKMLELNICDVRELLE